ncbi:unnamed protein product [Prunus armeniaca]
MEGLNLALPFVFIQKLTSGKSEGRFELMCEEMCGRFVFHASRAAQRINVPFSFSRCTVANPRLVFVGSESSVEAISDESLRHSRRFLTRSNGRSGNFQHSKRQARRISTKAIGNIVHDLYTARFKMSDSESLYEGEPNAFEGESSDGLFDSESEATENIGAKDGEDTDVEIIGEVITSVPTHGIGKGLMVRQLDPLAAIFRDGNHFGINIDDESSAARQSETSTSDRSEAAAEPSSRPRVSIVYPSNPRAPMGVPKEHLFGVDYLVLNKITEREIAKYRVEYRIPDSVKMRIPGATESLTTLKDGEVVFFTDVLIHGVWLPLQPAVQRILA